MEDGESPCVRRLVSFFLAAAFTFAASFGISLALVVMLLAHAGLNRLLVTVVILTQLLLCSMRYALSPLDSNLLTPDIFASLACRSVRTAKPSFLHVLVAARVSANLALGTVRNAQAALHDTVGAVWHGTLTTHAFAGTTRRQLAAIRVGSNAVGLAAGLHLRRSVR